MVCAAFEVCAAAQLILCDFDIRSSKTQMPFHHHSILKSSSSAFREPWEQLSLLGRGMAARTEQEQTANLNSSITMSCSR